VVLFAGTHEILNAAPSTPFHAVDVTEEGDVVGDVGDVEVREAFVAEEATSAEAISPGVRESFSA
jgi:hypothetical protein